MSTDMILKELQGLQKFQGTTKLPVEEFNLAQLLVVEPGPQPE